LSEIDETITKKVGLAAASPTIWLIASKTGEERAADQKVLGSHGGWVHGSDAKAPTRGARTQSLPSATTAFDEAFARVSFAWNATWLRAKAGLARVAAVIRTAAMDFTLVMHVLHE
jgi:hypothetical protein